MPARIIYLDQNKWIDLARSANGPGDQFTPVVEFVRTAKAAGAGVFPLSAAHYFESNKQHDDERFERLGRFMYELSGAVTIASPLAILRHEIEMAFARALSQRIEVQPFSLLGKGVGHALDMPGVHFKLRDPNVVVLEKQREALEKAANDAFQESLLTGRLPGGERHPRGRPDYSRSSQRFVSELYDFRKRLECDDKDLRERALGYYRYMLFNPRYGAVGMFALPYYLFFEALGPIVEITGYLVTVWAVSMGLVDWMFAELLFLVAIVYGTLNSVLALPRRPASRSSS